MAGDARRPEQAGEAVLHQAYYLPSMTPICTVIFENEPDEGTGEPVEAYRKRINHEWAGMSEIPGTYPFTLDRSVKAYRLNSFLHDLIKPAIRARFLSEPEVLFEEAGLTTEERNMLRARDWRALIHYGVIFFLLEKLGAVIGTTNLHTWAPPCAASRWRMAEDPQFADPVLGGRRPGPGKACLSVTAPRALEPRA